MSQDIADARTHGLWVRAFVMCGLGRAGHDRDAAVLAGAVLAHRDQQPALVREQRRLDEAMAQVRARMERPAVESALAEGARLSINEARRFARELIRAATAPT